MLNYYVGMVSFRFEKDCIQEICEARNYTYQKAAWCLGVRETPIFKIR